MITIRIPDHAIYFYRFLAVTTGTIIDPTYPRGTDVVIMREAIRKIGAHLINEDEVVFGLQRNWDKFKDQWKIPDTWHRVQFEDPDSVPPRFNFLLSNLEMQEWAEENVGPRGGRWMYHRYVYWFEDEKMATLFLLRWS